jgi:hypothetical protein
VVFPSFHATLAVLCAYAARPLRILKIPLLALNLHIILSSPAEGGHYFIDIIAGIILAALTISLPGYILSWIRRYLKKMFATGTCPRSLRNDVRRSDPKRLDRKPRSGSPRPLTRTQVPRNCRHDAPVPSDLSGCFAEFWHGKCFRAPGSQSLRFAARLARFAPIRATIRERPYAANHDQDHRRQGARANAGASMFR